MEFESAYKYITCNTDKRAQIVKIDAVIAALLDVALQAAETEHISEYNLDDGQVKIKATYKGTASVYASIAAFRKYREDLINELNGRVFRMVDSKSFNGRRY